MSDSPVDPGTQAVIDTFNPAPDTSSLPTSTLTPVPSPSSAISPPPDTSNLPVSSTPHPTDPTATASAPPQKPSLWRGILAGALQGLAAGASVNTRGMSSGSAVAAGAGAGVNQVLNVVPQQQRQAQQEQLQTAYHYAQLQQIQRQLNQAPDSKREQWLTTANGDYESMLKSGAVVPIQQPTDLVSAQNQLQQLHQKNPWAVYSIMPAARDEDGNWQYSAVQFPNGPTQEDIDLEDSDGHKVTIPAGSKSSDVGKYYTNFLGKDLDRDSRESIATQNNATKIQTNAATNATKLQTTQISAKAAAARQATMMAGQNVVAFDPDYQNPDGSTGGNVVMPKDSAVQRGLFNYKIDPSIVNANVAGLNDVQNKLNALASVANDSQKMSQVDPKLAAAMTDPTTGVTLSFGGHGGAGGAGASGGIGLATDRINAWLNNANVREANQATRDYVTSFLGAREAITQLPRLQTFGKSSRMSETQVHAALSLLPVPGDTASFAQQKMQNLQTLIDPLRHQMPHMPGAELIPSWTEQQQQRGAGSVSIPGLGTLTPSK